MKKTIVVCFVLVALAFMVGGMLGMHVGSTIKAVMERASDCDPR